MNYKKIVTLPNKIKIKATISFQLVLNVAAMATHESKAA